MLAVGPWRRLPLTVRWLQQKYCQDFPPDRQPPTHMPIAYGPLELTGGTGKRSGASKKSTTQTSGAEEEEEEEECSSPDAPCFICYQV